MPLLLLPHIKVCSICRMDNFHLSLPSFFGGRIDDGLYLETELRTPSKRDTTRFWFLSHKKREQNVEKLMENLIFFFQTLMVDKAWKNSIHFWINNSILWLLSKVVTVLSQISAELVKVENACKCSLKATAFTNVCSKRPGNQAKGARTMAEIFHFVQKLWFILPPKSLNYDSNVSLLNTKVLLFLSKFSFHCFLEPILLIV